VRASQAVSGISKLRVINTDSGSESLPLRESAVDDPTSRSQAVPIESQCPGITVPTREAADLQISSRTSDAAAPNASRPM
jgi:hypothetical protein